jgi:hypothetical protein
MNTATLQKPSRTRLYWYVWAAFVGVTLALRFTVFSGASEQRLFQLATAYAVGTWLPIMALNFIEGRRLASYLKSCHYQQWEQLSYIPFLGFVGHNGFRMVRWLYSKDDFGDPVLASMKREHRRFLRWVFIVFFSYVIIMPVLLGL